MAKYIDDEKILELKNKGLLHREIAEELGYGISTVTRHLLDMGIKEDRIDKDKVMALYRQGLYDREIAEILGCTRSNVTILLNKQGIINRHSKIEDVTLRGRISNSLLGKYTGEDNPNYKGYTDEKTIARGIFKTISKRVIRENDFTCAICGRRGGDLEAHHIKPFNVIFQEFINNQYDGDINDIYAQITNYPDFMDEDNLVVLCKHCHHRVHYTDDPELNPYRWESATTIENEP